MSEFYENPISDDAFIPKPLLKPLSQQTRAHLEHYAADIPGMREFLDESDDLQNRLDSGTITPDYQRQ